MYRLDITRALCFLAMCMGFLCVAAGLMLLKRKQSTPARLARMTMPVTARVMEVLKEERTEWKEDTFGIKRAHSRIVYTPLLEYEACGKTYIRLHFASGTASRFTAGASVEIFCNPDNPSEARYPADAGGLTAPLAAIVLGGAAVLMGIFKLIG